MIDEYIGSIYISQPNLGLSIYDGLQVCIQCTQILEYLPSDYDQINRCLNKCKTILLNHSPLNWLQVPSTCTITLIKDKALQDDIIQNNLNMLNHQNLYALYNQLIIIQRMKSFSYKYKALGMLLYHLLNQTNLLGQKKLYFQDIHYNIDTLLKNVVVEQKERQLIQIIHEEIHPSLVKGKGKSKEGFSVLNLYLCYLKSAGSKKIMRRLLLNPLWDKIVLRQRQNIIQWMCKQMNDINKFRKLFNKIHPVDSILKKINKMDVEEADWRKLIKTIQTMNQLKGLLNYRPIPNIIQEYIDSPEWIELIEILKLINKTLQFNPLGVRANIDNNLDQLKRTYDSMPHLLSLYAEKQNWSVSFRIIFMAQIGYLIKIDSQIEQSEEIQNWTLQFVSSTGKYYSNQLTQQLDQEYGDIYGEIQDHEQKIIIDLENIITQKQQILISMYWKICNIECFWGISLISKNMCRPKLSSENFIALNSWHLLLGQHAIDNHCFSFNHKQGPTQQVYNSEGNLVNTNYQNRCMLLSGPNGSGKTVYLKQISLLIYLAHVGLFLPAEMAQIPLIDRICCITTPNSLFSHHCGFQFQLQQLGYLLTKGIHCIKLYRQYSIRHNLGINTNKSLILIDQIGSHADYTCALKVVISSLYKIIYAIIKAVTKASNFIINEQMQMPQDHFQTPLCLIITHLTQIMIGSLLPQNNLLRYLTMQVQQQNLCLYKIKPGLVRKNYGIQCAQKILSAQIMKKAKQYYKLFI